MAFVTYPIYNCPFPCVSTLRVQIETIVKIIPKISLILWQKFEANILRGSPTFNRILFHRVFDTSPYSKHCTGFCTIFATLYTIKPKPCSDFLIWRSKFAMVM